MSSILGFRERRMSQRKRVMGSAYIYWKGQRTSRCHIINLSARGMFIEDVPRVIPKGSRIDLVIPVTVAGSLVKLYRFSAFVLRICDAGAGLILYKNIYSHSDDIPAKHNLL